MQSAAELMSPESADGVGGNLHPLQIELAVTDAHLAAGEDLVARELGVLRALFPACLQPLQAGDAFAGRLRHPLVGFGPEPRGFLGFYCDAAEIQTRMAEWTPAQREDAKALLDYWQSRTTNARTRAAYPPELAATLPSDEWMTSPGIAFPLYRMAGTVLDFARLLQRGIPGLQADVQQRMAGESDPTARRMLEGLLEMLELLIHLCHHYQRQATGLASDATNAAERAGFSEVAQALAHVIHHPPQTLRQAIQLLWIHVLFSGTWNYGRMDVYLGPFLSTDIAVGRLDEAKALRLLQSFWRLITAYDNMWNNRIIIGGAGRADEASADAFAMLAMEATRTVHTNQPQLSLRFHAGQNPSLLDKAYDVLGEGRTFPMLYNDEVNIPAVMKAFNLPRGVAEQYTPYGCGEYIIEHCSTGTPSGVLNLAKAVEAALRDGIDPGTGRRTGTATGTPEGFHTFEDLWTAYARQVEHHIAALALQEKIEYDVAGSDAHFLALSLLHDDCLARGQGIFSGGVRYLGGTIETYGNTNAADSLTAIDQLVFQQKKLSLKQIVEACDANFDGQAVLRQELLSVPKYGNDDDTADAMAQRVHRHVCQAARSQAEVVGLHSYLVVVINNSANTSLGRHTGATPDGRGAGQPLANANNPSPGQDRSGATAFLNSLVKLDPSLHAGAVQNMKFARSMFTGNRAKLRAMMEVYFASGGAQAMITVVNRQDLESAMREPEKWAHLMVRVGGFSARFIDLSRDVQMEILERTLHE